MTGIPAVAIERAIAAGKLERRTAAPRATRRHLPPNRADYTQPNGDRPEHITAAASAKRDTVSPWNQIGAFELMLRRGPAQ